MTMSEEQPTLRETVEWFIEAVESAKRARESKGGQQVPFHGDFASINPSSAKALDYWAARLKLALNNKCQCQWEAGDSACDMRGIDE